MAQLTGMDNYEADIAKKLARLLQSQLKDVMGALGDPPDYANIDPAVWEKLKDETGAAMLPEVEAVYLAAAEQTMLVQPIGVDWALVNERAAGWADNHVGQLIQGLDNTSRNNVQRKVAAYFRESSTVADLKKSLQSTFGAVRAEAIAVTEATRAAAEGQLEIVAQLRAQGVEMEVIWETAMDELTCPICSPLQGKVQGIDWADPPPAHVRCRCWLNSRFKNTGQEF